MFKNYFKTAWRNLLKNKFYSAINMAGLSIGLAVGIMVLMWVQDELSYDGFHKNAGNIYKINSHLGTGTSAQVWNGSPGPLAVFCKQIPEVSNVVRINNIEEQVEFRFGEKKFRETGLAFVDSTFFSVFDFKLREGNTTRPFPDINSVILSSSTAKKYFGNEEALGKTLVSEQGNFIVSGVMEDFPANSSLQYKMLLPVSLYAEQFTASGGNGDWKTMDEDLGNFYFNTYVQLRKGADADKVAQKITDIYVNKRGDDPAPKNNFFALQSLKTLHLVAANGNTGALQTVRIFLVVAILILLIACINYVNLSTARSMLRSKEVSVRKIIGAAKNQLFFQFIIESALLFLFASLFGFLLIYILLPLYNNLSGKQLVFSLASGNVWLVVGGAIFGTLALAGIYPALQLSAFRPINALKGKLSFGIANTSFRKILVVTQFVFSTGLIIGTIVIGSQLKYIREKDLGFDKEHVFSFSVRNEVHDHLNAVKNELLQQPGILGLASSNSNIAGVNSTTGDTYWEGKEEGRTFLIHPNTIDEKFISFFKIQIIAGNNFTGSKADSAHFILNETAVKQAGIQDPIGKNFTLWQTKGTIIGIVKDFNYASLKQAVEPAIFQYSPSNWRIFIKTTGKDAPKAIAAAQKIWKKYARDFPFDYSFVDDDFNKMYLVEQRQGILFNAFGMVAIIISCLGLLGLATYTANVKIKEIGIRKVLGAGMTSLTNLLVKEFALLILIAFVISSPVAWLLMNKWLQNFAYRMNIGWWVFALAGTGVFLLALLTISFQAIKAALANPVKSLRTE